MYLIHQCVRPASSPLFSFGKIRWEVESSDATEVLQGKWQLLSDRIQRKVSFEKKALGEAWCELGISCEACGADWLIPVSEQAAAFSGREEKETIEGCTTEITIAVACRGLYGCDPNPYETRRHTFCCLKSNMFFYVLFKWMFFIYLLLLLTNPSDQIIFIIDWKLFCY